MRAKLFLSLLLSLQFGLISNSWSEGKPENRVSEVAIKGLVHASEEIVRNAISVQLGDDLTRRETELKIRRDVSAIVDLKKFKNVTVAQEDTTVGKRVIYQVYEYPILTEVTFSGNKKLKSSFLKGELIPDKRMLFMDPETEQGVVDKLKKTYQTKGYSDVTIDHTTSVSGGAEATIQFTVEEGTRTKIAEATIKGNFAFTKKQILKKIKSKPSWFIFTHRYDKAQVDADIATLTQMYHDLGHLDAKITFEPPAPSSKPGGLALTIQVDEGKQYVVGGIKIEGNTLYTEDEIREAMESDRGQVFNESQFNKDLEAVRNLYRDQGYILAQIQPKTEKDQQTDVLDISLTISEGHIVYLGKVALQGMTTFDDGGTEPIKLKTKDYVILREIRMKWDKRMEWNKTEGGETISVFEQKNPPDPDTEEPYVLDWGEVKKSQRRLANLGFFKKDRISFEPTLTEDPNVMDLLLRLEEQHTGNISFGGGFSTEFGASLFFGFTEKNLFGKGQSLELNGEIGSRRQSFRASFTDPYIFNSDYSGGVDLYNTTISKFKGRDFEESRTGGALRLGKKYSEHNSWSLRLKHEVVELTNVTGTGKVIAQSLPSEYEELSTTVNSLTFGLTKDTRDFYEAPTDGVRQTASIEQAGFGGTPFTKVKATSAWYTKLNKKLVLAVNGELGAISGFSGEVPLSERFFLGGAETVRGYQYGTISPVDFVTYWRDDHGLSLDRQDVRVGGEEMGLLKTELRYPITNIIEGVAFLDAGGVWRDLGKFTGQDVRYGTGLGLRINLPIGAMVRLDYGFAVNPDEYQETQPIHFSFGQSF